ncbi:hypothetical protein [Actinoplanes sp. NPDC026670]|uniref:hypothetical protein n=1 Tax=Actinoplanes sp. NPDC026670 TaxID=3154700 RepID=UPI0033C098CE
MDSRELTDRERAVLTALLAVDFVGAAALREQAAAVRVVDGCPCGCPTIHFAAGGGPGVIAKVNGYPRGSHSSLFLYTVVGADDRELLGGIEWAGIDESPAEFPPPESLELSVS